MNFYSAARKIFDFQDKDFEAITKLPQGFKNNTDGNDSCPSLFHDVSMDDGFYVRIYIDYKDMKKREIPETKRYTVYITIEDEDYYLETDNWQEVLKISLVAVDICKLAHNGDNVQAMLNKYNFEVL